MSVDVVCAAKTEATRALPTTITFLGEQQDIIGPEAAILVGGQTTKRKGSVHQQPVEDLSGLPPGHPTSRLLILGRRERHLLSGDNDDCASSPRGAAQAPDRPNSAVHSRNYIELVMLYV